MITWTLSSSYNAHFTYTLPRWNYDRFFVSLKESLDKEFPNKIEYEPIQDIDVTGNFEITLMQTGQRIHSKKHGELGTCDSVEEKDRLKKILKAYLSYQSSRQCAKRS